MTDLETAFGDISEEISTVLVGNEELIEQLTISLLTDGHTLIEGVPGIAKTTAANLFANVLGIEYKRIQMTPDLLPADLIGTHVYRPSTERSELVRGPLFSNVVVVDEINRASAKTQSALLEAMEEGTVTIEGETLSLPEPFMIIATQNQIEQNGTFELPEAQRDRFQFKISLNAPDREIEREILDRSYGDGSLEADTVSPLVGPEDIRALRTAVDQIHVAEPIKKYILDITTTLRESEYVSVGPSPRASLAFLSAGQARAGIHGRAYVTPDDIKALVDPILTHRLMLTREARVADRTATDVISETMQRIETPSETAKPESMS